MILTMSRKLALENERARHTQSHQNCVGFCAWGYSNPKHGDYSGGVGRAGSRKKRGWHKGWYKRANREKV